MKNQLKPGRYNSMSGMNFVNNTVLIDLFEKDMPTYRIARLSAPCPSQKHHKKSKM